MLLLLFKINSDFPSLRDYAASPTHDYALVKQLSHDSRRYYDVLQAFWIVTVTTRKSRSRFSERSTPYLYQCRRDHVILYQNID